MFGSGWKLVGSCHEGRWAASAAASVSTAVRACAARVRRHLFGSDEAARLTIPEHHHDPAFLLVPATVWALLAHEL
jgi:hypothetical protein